MATKATRQGNGHSRQRAASTKAKATSKAKPRRGSNSGTARKTSAAARKTSGAARKTGAAARKTGGAARKTADAVKKQAPKPNKVAGKLARKAIKRVATKALDAGAEMIRNAADRAAATGSEVVDEAVAKPARRRLPIQRAVDVAVPIRVAWEEWMALECLPEGTHVVTDIDRDGDELVGRTDGLRETDWAADVLDERDQQSFAWQSREGSDCAGLVTFHRLSDRLTRIELNLDVVPTTLGEAAQLATRIADRRAETELRKLKARLELINPDLYEDEPDATEEGGEEPAEPEADDNEDNEDEPGEDE